MKKYTRFRGGERSVLDLTFTKEEEDVKSLKAKGTIHKKLNHKKTEFMDINVPRDTMHSVRTFGIAIVESIKFVGAHTISEVNPSCEFALKCSSKGLPMLHLCTYA